MVDGLFQDVRFGVRMIAKHPMSSAVTILTLTLGIGLDAGVFTLLDGMVFRPRVAHDAASFVEVRTAALMSVDGGRPSLAVFMVGKDRPSLAASRFMLKQMKSVPASGPS